MNKFLLVPALILVGLVWSCGSGGISDEAGDNPEPDPSSAPQSSKFATASSNALYNPVINPENFVEGINNPYMTWTPGTTFVYRGVDKDGIHRIETMVTHKTKKILGVTCIEVLDRDWLQGQLVEATRDWYAQDIFGTVWYFGEATKEYENGKVVSTAGSWLAGVNGAQPGIVMLGTPIPGIPYWQEFLSGEAEDMAVVLSLDESVQVPYGTFEHCLLTGEWTPLEPKVVENKYYCLPVGQVTLTLTAAGGHGREALTDITH